MPDTKITALTALTAADPANDVLPIVDVSDTTMAASGTTKKISINNVLGCSGTATLASATITGNLTVDTNTLFVDSVNNRVGVGTASPNGNFHVSGGTSGINSIFDTPSAGNTRIELRNNATRAGYVYWDTSEFRLFADSGRALTFYPNGTQAMTLDSGGNLLVGLATAGTTAAKTIQIANGTAPTANVTGGQLYVEAGALKYRGSSGTVTTLANA